MTMMTIWEIGSYAAVLLVWLFFRKALHRNITGDILVGAVFGFFLEFSTTPIADYHFKLTIYKDLPLVIPFAWGMMFAITSYLSEKLYQRVTGQSNIAPGDKRILLFDFLCGIAVGFPLETIGTHMHVWDYNFDKIGWTLGSVPIFHMPWEALISYGLIMLIGPTFIRYWEGAFEGRL